METMEFAVIHTGGKQYKVASGDTIKIEKLPGEFKQGDKITFNEVLMLDDGSATTLGTPYISGAKVTGTFEGAGRAQKVIVIKYKQKSRYYKKNGHRQHYFSIKIDALK